MMRKDDYRPPKAKEKLSLRGKAHKWMDENPDMMGMFRYYAQQMLSRERSFGIGLLTERVRWEAKVKWEGDYKISNNHRAYIARQLIEEMPLLADYIVLRRTYDT